MHLSLFGERFSQDAGILELMDDLGRALEGPGTPIMLGGGNPAAIPEMNALWRREWARLASGDGELEAVLAQYDAPGGRDAFRRAVASFLKDQYGWNLGPRNIAITSGSQSACFLLFNLLTGDFRTGPRRRALFPLSPEYIGYADQGLTGGQLIARRPLVVDEDGVFFKYHVDFAGLSLGEDIGLVCAGRPTNPTGNLLSDDEVGHLAGLARRAGIPLLLDNAYGAPFPGILFDPVTPYWDEGTILTLSLSKLGLPSVRTGIVVGPEPVVAAVEAANSIVNLTNAGLGQALVQPLLASGALADLARRVVQPHYRAARDFALEVLQATFGRRFPWRVHRPQGSIFLWLWFPDLAQGSREVYRRLKDRGVLVVPGDAFFFGLGPDDEDWPHRRQCLRVNYARPPGDIEVGLAQIAEVVEELAAEAQAPRR